MNLAQLSKIVSNEDSARELLEKMRWNGNAICPHCDAEKAYQLTPGKDSKTRKGVWKCRVCRKQFSVTVGTIFEGSRIPISKWLLALHLICSSKKGISALQLSRNLGITYKSAWFMAHRIRYGMSQEPIRSKLKGTVEADETYIGGKVANMHQSERKKLVSGGHGQDKAAVLTLVERDGRVQTRHLEHVTSLNIKRVLRETIAANNAFLMSDSSMPYRDASRMFLGHQAVNHSIGEYVRGTGDGAVHCNTAESVHALLKRGVMGVYHHWSKKHLHRYLAEFDFRWNTRKITDGERMSEAVTMVGGKRLKYSDPIKKR